MLFYVKEVILVPKTVLKGITVKIGGDTTDLIKAMDKAETAGKRLSNTAENLKKKLVFKWDSATFERAQKAAQLAVQETEKRVDALKQALAQVQEVDTAKAQKQITELQKQIEKAEADAEKARFKLQEINLVKLDHIIQKANDLGNTLVGLGAKMTVGITAPIALAANEAVQLSSDLAESQNVIEVAFGESSAAIDKWSQGLLDSFGLSELSAKQYAGTFMTLSNSMGVANSSGTEMSKTLTELSSDMASFYNARQDVAANALKGIFTGETESLKQFGVVMTEASLSSFALSEGISTAYKDMTQAEKVMLRYQFVIEALSQAQGDFSGTSDSLANQQRVLTEQLKVLAIELGNELLPIAQDVVGWINQMVKYFSQMTEEEKKAIITIAALAAAMGPLLTATGGISKAVSTGTTLWKAHVTAMAAAKAATIAGESATKAYTASLTANAAALGAATAGVSLLITALVGLVTYAYHANTAVDTLGAQMQHTASVIDTCNQSLDDLQRNGLEGATAELGNLKNMAENVVPRIEELAEKTNRTAEETEELQALIPYLNEQLGYEAASFDSATGAIDMNTGAIYANIEAMQKRAMAAAAESKITELASQLIDVESEMETVGASLLEQQEILDKTMAQSLAASGTTFNLTVAQQQGRVTQLNNQYSELLSLQKDINAEMTDFQKKYILPLYRNQKTQQTAATAVSGIDGMTREQREAEFKKNREELQYMRSIGVIDQAEYRKNMNAINAKYNSDDTEVFKQHYYEINNVVFKGENKMTNTVKSGGGARSSSVKAATAEQTAYVKKAYQEQVEAAKSAYEQQKALLKSNYDAAIKQIDAELKAKEAAINAEIDAINKQIEARRRAKQEEEYGSQINALQASIEYGGGKFDEFTLRQLQAQLAQVEEERADYRWELEQQDRIDALEQELEDARTLAEAQKEALQEMYEKHLEMLEEEYNLHLAQLDEIFKTADGEFKAISQEFVAAMQSGAAGAAATLRSAINALESANANYQLQQQQNVKPSQTTDNRTYSMTLNNAGYTDAQAAKVFRSMMYE